MKLTDQQAAAVSEAGNLLLTACPGSGKTRTLIAKAVREIENLRGTPRRVCCITYTNTAAQEIEERAALELQPGDERQLAVSTIHSFCLNEILRPYGWLLPEFTGATRVITRDNVNFEAIAQFAAARINYFWLSASDYEAFESLTVDGKGRIVGLAAQNAAVARAAPYYWARCAELGFVDFGTIIYVSFRILRDHPRVALTLCAKYAWILVDEFQDTTELQIEILKQLFATRRSKFFLVGDLHQSIYAFTGARPELVAPFGAHIGARANLSLSQNFRSSNHIVTHAERLFPRAPAMTANGPDSAFPTPPVLVRGVSSFVAITEQFLPKLQECGITLGDATILGKDWGSLIALARQLRAFGVPIVGPGARPYRRSRLFASLAEQLCGAVVEVQPDTMRQLERALFHTVQDITGHVRLDLFSHEGRVVIIRLLRRATALAEGAGASQWLDQMSRSTGEILSQAGLIDQGQATSLYASVQEMKADMARQNVDTANLTIEDLGLFASPTRALRLSTIHYAKGREYGAVAIIGLRTGTFPHFRATAPDALLGEKRLFYVGVTRAEKLLMYIAERDNWNNAPSPFLGRASGTFRQWNGISL
jgi:DNA helicase II / ATP-dependent DNA helicase PcrA